MRNKLWFLTKISLEKKIKSKWFVTTNILLLVLIICLANVDSIIKFFGGTDIQDSFIAFIGRLQKVQKFWSKILGLDMS